MLLGNLSAGSGGNIISGSSLVGGPPKDKAELQNHPPSAPVPSGAASGRE